MKSAKIPGLKLGVTGGIGSGKTSVCKVFNVLGIPVFSADYEARQIMENDESIIGSINSIAGRDLYTNGTLDRKMLASIIFNDHNILNQVNSLVHPAVFEKFAEWGKKQSADYVIIEAAILYESGGAKIVDRTATVVAPVEERVARVIRRNLLTREEVLERMHNQMDDEEKIKLSYYVINNSENDMIIPAILKIHLDILNHINTCN